MCGVAGFCDFNKRSDENILKNMTDVLHHRGPDDSGYSFNESEYAHIGLGHRRLSILDLSKHGHQPMKYESLEIVYNGEIYNFLEIREELIGYGYRFDSDSDTEVIIKAYSQWGIKAVDRFNGMFAICIYDKLLQKLIFIRDRAGVKPLYYYNDNQLFMFSSELKSFHEHKMFKKEIDLESLGLFFQFGYIPQPYSIFKNTYKLKAGHYLEIDLKSHIVGEKVYWDVIDYYNKEQFILNDTEAINQTEKILKKAFEYRMVSDVPVGVFLSGGYDSSIVTALLQSERTEKLKTFTIGFHDEKINEAHHAKNVAKHLGTEHTEYYCGEDEAMDIFPTLCEIYDEPFGDISALPTILVSKIAKRDVTVSLSADGADEIFGGYGKYLSTIEKQLKIKSIFKTIGCKNKNINKFAKMLQHNGFVKDPFFENKVAKLIYEDNLEVQKLTPYYNTPISNESLIKGYKYKKLQTSYDDIDKLKSNLDTFNKMFAIDYKTYMVDDILHKVDRATMSVGLEGREPFLDNKIIEFVSRLPSDMKIRNGDKKWLLKEIAHKYIPKKIMDRPKQGFGIPEKEWLNHELKEYVEEYLSDKHTTVLDTTELIKIKNLFFSGKVSSQLVWNIIIFQMWYKKWM